MLCRLLLLSIGFLTRTQASAPATPAPYRFADQADPSRGWPTYDRYADAFAYSSHSGFPRTAACRALLSEAIHTCFHYEGPLFNKDQPTARECTGPYSVYQLGERHAAGL